MTAAFTEVRSPSGWRSIHPMQAFGAAALGVALGVVGVLLVAPFGVSANDGSDLRAVVVQDARGRAALRAVSRPQRFADPIAAYFEPILTSFSPRAYRSERRTPPAIAYSYAPRGGSIRIMDQTGGHRRRAEAAPIPPAPRAEQRREAARPQAAALQSRRTECVRLCDGYHFPIGNLASSSDLRTHEAMCQAACPDAQVALFTVEPGQPIERAASRDFRSYASLPAAFAYRANRSASCVCNRGVTQARLSILHDPTLRPGDAVVTADGGAKVFNGSRTWPLKPSDFVDFAASKRLTASERKSVDALVGATYAQNLLKPYNVARAPRPPAEVATVEIVRPAAAQRTSIVRVIEREPDAAPSQGRGATAIVALKAPPRALRLVEGRSAPGFVLR